MSFFNIEKHKVHHIHFLNNIFSHNRILAHSEIHVFPQTKLSYKTELESHSGDTVIHI